MLISLARSASSVTLNTVGVMQLARLRASILFTLLFCQEETKTGKRSNLSEISEKLSRYRWARERNRWVRERNRWARERNRWEREEKVGEREDAS
tara:strand:+ start:1237 stop:1521 length:285 start_codon:yes stop_codon:yes gene_type:complete